MKSILDRLFEHMYWADELALDALREAGDLSLTSRALFAHVLGAEETWLARLEGRTPKLAVWPELSIGECARGAEGLRAAYTAYLARQTEETLQRPVHYRNSAGTEFDSRVDDILAHVAMHGAYHRGQVALALRQEGARPNPTDFIAFIRGTPTATKLDAERVRNAAVSR